MSDYCVWLWPGQGVSAIGLEKISNALGAGSGSATSIDAGGGIGLSLAAGTRQISHFLNDEALLVVDGLPAWKVAGKMPGLDSGDRAAHLYQGYRHYGDDLMQHLTGSFSIAVIDRREPRAFFAIDRMGIRALSYANAKGGGVVIGSSSRAVACHPATDSSISNQSIYNYLFFHVIPSPDTIFNGVSKLPPAFFGTYRKNQFTTERYWCPRFAGNEAAPEDAGTKLVSCIDDAVRTAAGDSDKVGCFLSGGLDSSTIAGMMAKQRPDRPVDAYTIGFAQEGYDEMEFARCAASEFGLNLHEHYIKIEDIIDGIETVTDAFDEPFGNSSAIPAYFCASQARADGKTMLLAGDGGDELFGGNERYAKQKIFDAYRMIPGKVRESVLEPLLIGRRYGRGLALLRKTASYIEQARLPMPDRTQSYNFLHRTDISRIFPDEFMRTVDVRRPFSLMDDEYSAARADCLVDRMLFMDWKFTLADNDLRKVGKATEAAGIDVAYPLLDDRLVSLSTTIPASSKVHFLTLRHFYKKSLNNFLPDKIINKSKHGFGLPFGEWLLSSADMRSIVVPAVRNLAERGILRPEFIDDLLDRHESEHAAYYGNFVWVLFMLERWLDRNSTRGH